MGGSPGFCMMRLKLKSMNGLLKSMSFSLKAVIVIGASTMSLFWSIDIYKLFNIINITS